MILILGTIIFLQTAAICHLWQTLQDTKFDLHRWRWVAHNTAESNVDALRNQLN